MKYLFFVVFFAALWLGNQAKADLPKKPIQKIQVKEGQTAYSIAKEYGLTLNQLHRYNNFIKFKPVLNSFVYEGTHV